MKIFWEAGSMNREMRIYKELNAFDEKIEEKQIPRVYWNGKIFEKHYAIVMSLFEGTLADYYTKPDKKRLSDTHILYVFLQTVRLIITWIIIIILIFFYTYFLLCPSNRIFQVKALKYLSSKSVVHHDIKPSNLFYRGRDVFIGGEYYSIIIQSIMPQLFRTHCSGLN